MTKREVLRYMEEKRKEGYMTHKILLQLFDDDEEVPDLFVEMACHKPEPIRPLVIYGGADLSDFMNKAFQDYSEARMQQDIAEEALKYLHNNKN